MNESVLAKRYINALCDATPTSDREETLDILSQIIETLRYQQQFWSIAVNPKISVEKKYDFVREVVKPFKPNQHLENFFHLLIQKKRLNLLKYAKPAVELRLERIRNTVGRVRSRCYFCHT